MPCSNNIPVRLGIKTHINSVKTWVFSENLLNNIPTLVKFIILTAALFMCALYYPNYVTLCYHNYEIVCTCYLQCLELEQNK